MTNESIAAEMRECALRKNDEGYAGTYRLLNDAADLIEQQEVEIEQFKGDNIKLLGNWDTLCNKTQKYYADLYRDAVMAERADAIKEFAKRLKEITLGQRSEYHRIMDKNHPVGSALWEYWHGKDTEAEQTLNRIDQLLEEMNRNEDM